MAGGDIQTNTDVRAYTLFDLNPDGVFCLDPTGVVVDVNPAAARLAGRPRDEMIGAHFSVFFAPEHLPLGEETYTRVAAGNPVPHQTLTITRPDGTEMAVDVSAFPTMVDDKFVGICGIARDVTERVRDREELRRSEEALRESENLFRQLIDNIDQVFYLADRDTDRLLFLSPQFEEVWGQSREEAQASSRGWLKVVHPEDRERIVESSRGLAEYQLEYRLLRPDGSIAWVHDKGSPVRDESGRITRVAGIVEDVTEKKLLEEQLRQAQKMESIGQLAGGVAHDFNNLLLVILNSAQFLDESLPAGDHRRHDVVLISEAAERGASLVRHLLAFSRKQIVDPKDLNVNDVIDEMETLLRRTVGERIEFLVKKDEELSLTRIDRNQLGQVLMNLVVNASNAMPQGGTLSIETRNVVLTDDIDISLDPVPDGEYVCLSISDTGHGIDKEHLPKVFEPFFSTKSKAEATGLGLSTVYGIVSQAGGRVSVYSELRIGTTFKVYLPAVDGVALQERRIAHERRGTQRDEVVLVAEDDPVVSTAIAKMLQREGFTVLHASTGPDALKICRTHEGRIDVVLADVVMPGMSGRELGIHVQTARPDLAIVYMSGYSEDMIGRHGILQADENYLQKPFTSGDLVSKIEQVLRKR